MFLTWVMGRALLRRQWQIVFSGTQKDVVVTGTFLFGANIIFKRRKVGVDFCIPWKQADGDTIMGKAVWISWKLLADVGNIRYFIFGNIFPCCYILFCFWSNRSLSPGWYSFEGLEMGFWSWQICPDRGWYMPIHHACGIGFVETCSPFSMLVCAFCRCWIVARWWKSWNHVPRPQKILRHPKPKTTHCLLFALFWSMFGRARITSTPLTVNLVIISSIRQGSLVCCFEGFGWLGLKEGNAMVIRLMVQKSGQKPPFFKLINWNFICISFF